MGSGVIAKEVGDDLKTNLLPMKYGGRSFYCRKCKQVAPEGLVLADITEDFCFFVEVLGIGPNVGTRVTRGVAKRMKRPRQLPEEIQVGDILLCPKGNDIGIERARGLSNHEFFIEESVPLGILTDA